MTDNPPDVPPSLLLLIREMAQCASYREMRSRFRGMLTELRDQSEAFELESMKRKFDSQRSLRFEVHLHGALDLLSGEGCRSVECRIAAAERIARSVGLIADRVWLTDTLSERFVDFGRATNAKIDEAIADVMVAARLLPLIRAGIVRFRSPWMSTCQSCAQEFESQIGTAASDVAKVFRRDIRIERMRGGGYVAKTGKCLEPPLVLRSSSRKKLLPDSRQFAERWIAGQLRSTFWTAREASLTGGSILSNSRVGLAGLLSAEGRLVDRRSLLLLDKQREFSLPWVSELNALQIVQLREEASAALPALREKLARAMSIATVEAVNSENPSALVAELREQSAEVRAELDSKRRSSARFWKVTYGLLGLGLSAYGVASDQLLPGVGGLLSVVHLLISHKTGHEADVSKLKAKPGYVLLKAQDILSHAH